jgi:hypothetical protein
MDLLGDDLPIWDTVFVPVDLGAFLVGDLPIWDIVHATPILKMTSGH